MGIMEEKRWENVPDLLQQQFANINIWNEKEIVKVWAWSIYEEDKYFYCNHNKFGMLLSIYMKSLVWGIGFYKISIQEFKQQ